MSKIPKLNEMSLFYKSVLGGLGLLLIIIILGVGLASVPHHKLAAPTTATSTSLYKDKKYDKAIDSVKKYIKEKPNDAESYNFLANIYRDKGENDLAIENYNKSIGLNESFAAPRVNLAGVLVNLGKKDDTRKVIKDGLKVFPDNKLLKDYQDQVK